MNDNQKPPAPRASWPNECIANGATCSFGPHGPGGEIQCQHCGAPPETSGQPETPHYQVTLSRQRWEHRTVRITAASPVEALSIAAARVKQGRYADGDWNCGALCDDKTHLELHHEGQTFVL
jgi:hypothetical protein